MLRAGVGADAVGAARDWERVRARQNGVRIEGWICARGSGLRGVQFIAVNGFPLAHETELHREANRVFAASSFGAVEDGKNGTRKGVERRPMFVLRIECVAAASALGGEGGTDGKAGVEGENLKHVIQLLQKLLFEFLKAHHFKPLAVGSKGSANSELSENQDTASTQPAESSESRERAKIIDLGLLSRVKAGRYDAKEVEGRYTNGGTPNFVLARSIPVPSTASASIESRVRSDESNEVINWTNPTTGKVYNLNTRTGNTTLPGPKRSGDSQSLNSQKRISLPRRTDSDSARVPGPFVQNLINTWKNPVFPPAPRAPLPSLAFDCDRTHDFTASTSQRIGKMTKAGLQTAQVIAQVDNKYVLLRMSGSASPSRKDPEMLVMLDQHAADERIRVERLFRELCTAPAADLAAPISFVVSESDRALLRKHEPGWRRWGARYAVRDAQRTVDVTALPDIFRGRCESAADRAAVIELLRSGAYEFEERGAAVEAEVEEAEEAEQWVRLLSRIPSALKEMANTRACRGAIMFNDPLTLQECRALVARLGQCRWPFMCAHGRVSMRPLVELGDAAGERTGGFREAFRKREARSRYVCLS